MDLAKRKLERAAAAGEPDAARALERYRVRAHELPERSTTSDRCRIKIDGEIYTVSEFWPNSAGFDACHIETDQGPEFILAASAEEAGRVARERWEEMARHDPREFATIVGEDTLVAWALGHSAGPGSVHCRSLEEWLSLAADYPEEELATYDGTERTVDRVGRLREIGFTPTVAYRSN